MASESRDPGGERPDDGPIDYFLEDMTYHGRSPRTREAYERVLREFESFLSQGQAVEPAEATHRDCMAWVHTLRGDHADSTVATYASYLHRFYAYMTQVGRFDSNPMSLVIAEMDERVDADPVRRDVSVPEMREFVATIRHPLARAVILTFLKTGIRAGELCNLDCRDLTLASDLTANSETRGQLAGRADSLFVSPDPAVGEVINGERRTAANKRKRTTVIPVDDELRRALERWLAVRPDPVSPADPLFVSTTDEWGHRLTTDMVHHLVATRAERMDWRSEGGGAAENVTPHYFRHFFTTHLRDRTGDRGVVKYLRGDVADDIIDTYTHNWGDRVRETYEENVYRLGSS